MEGSKELNDIVTAIQKWVDKYNGDVQFIGSFMAFKGKNFDVVDNRIIAYGLKSNMKLSLDELTEQIEKEQEEFVNW